MDRESLLLFTLFKKTIHFNFFTFYLLFDRQSHDKITPKSLTPTPSSSPSTTAVTPTTMEATLLSFPSSKPPFSQTQTHFRFRPTNPLSSSIFKPTTSYKSPRTLIIKSAISRSRKEETVETVKTQLENCYLVAAIEYKGFTVKQFQELRRSLPETSKLLVAKNTLVYKAIEGTQWEALKPCMTGMNAWLFVHSEEIPEAIKPYRDFQKEKKVENDFAGTVFEGKFLCAW